MTTLIIVSVLGLIAMVSEILGFRKFIFPIALVGLFVALGFTYQGWIETTMHFGMIRFDPYAAAFSGLILILVMIWMIISRDQYNQEFNISDHYALILFCTVGAIVMVSFWNLAMLFIGIEIISIPMYILAGSRKNDLSSNEASLKYFMMGAFTTGILLFGIALVYGASGTFDLHAIANYVRSVDGEALTIFYSGIILIMIALCFKVSAVPFHFWAPDVYQGAPTIITAFMATVIKTAAFGAFFRLFKISFAESGEYWMYILSVISAATILAGNILAVAQNNVKRMLAYSGIAQAGYLLMALLVLNEDSSNALLFYLASYGLATLAAFAVLYLVSKSRNDESFEAFNSLGKTDPLLGLVMTIAMLSLAGIPPAVGFFAKFYLFTSVLASGYTWLVIIAVIGSLISVYFYFRIIIAIYGKEAEVSKVKMNFLLSSILVIMMGLIVILGVAPNLFVDVIR